VATETGRRKPVERLVLAVIALALIAFVYQGIALSSRVAAPDDPAPRPAVPR
jgi:hypothetical protein